VSFRCPGRNGPAAPPRRRPLAAVAVVAVSAVWLAVPSAGSAASGALAGTGGVPGVRLVPAGSSPGQLARLEARAASLAKQYRGQLNLLDDAGHAAKVAVTRAQRLRHQLSHARQNLGRLAAASYMSGAQNPAIAVIGDGNPQRMLQDMAAVDHLAGEQSAQEQALAAEMATGQRAARAARAKVADLRLLIAKLAAQRHRVAALIARFAPQSPIAGNNITPRMQAVKNAVDRRFGPFPVIGCWRAGNDGEHPLGRACDFMLSTGGTMPTAANAQRGDQIAAWAQAHASQLGIMYIIYRQRIWDIRMASAGWVPMADRGSVTANHFDHVHISVF
jgi:hypothetical protein